MSSSDKMQEMMRKLLSGPGIGDDSDDNCGNTVDKKEALNRLRDAADRYLGSNGWRVGDIVTARKYCNIRGEGAPHVVVATLPDGVYLDNIQHYQGGDGIDDKFLLSRAMGNGRPRLNTRVLSLRGDQVVPMWVEHWQLETYVPEDDEDKRH